MPVEESPLYELAEPAKPKARRKAKAPKPIVRKGPRLLSSWHQPLGWIAPVSIADTLQPVAEAKPTPAIHPSKPSQVRLPITLVSGWLPISTAIEQDKPKILLQDATAEGDAVNTKRIVEALLFAANRPMTIKQLQEAFPEWSVPTAQAIAEALVSIAEDYQDRPIGLKELASGYRFQVKDGMAEWVTRLFEEKPPRYSRALLETMAIIAYRQPVTRGEIEDIRGVSVSTSIVQTLLEREWVRVIGHKEVPGRPALYSTTKQFLDYFNLSSLTELPTLMEIVDLDLGDVNQLSNDQENREQRQTTLQQDSDSNTDSQAQAEFRADSQQSLDHEIDPERQLH